VTVCNAGVGGNDTYDALGRIDADVVARHPDTVIVQFGINDSYVYSKVQGDPSAVAIDATTQVGHPYAYRGNYTANLDTIVNTLKNDGARVILMTPNQLRTTGVAAELAWQNDLLGQYAQVVRNVAADEGVELFDVWQMYSNYAAIPGNSIADLLVDSQHPNQLGHRMVADGLIGIIVPEPGSLALLITALFAGTVWLGVKLRGVRAIAVMHLVMAGLGLGTATAAPLFEEQDLFARGDHNIAEYRIPGLITTDKGTLIAVCDARVSKPGDQPNNIDLAVRRSSDGGKTWSPVQFIVDYPGKQSAADPCILQDRQTGTIWVFFAYGPEGIGTLESQPGWTGPTFQYQCVSSDDDGKSWSKPRDITPMVKDKTWNAFWPGPGRGTQLRSGRLVIPSTSYQKGRQPEWSTFVIYSDDHGKTWQTSALAGQGTSESQLVELDDGSLLLNMRYEVGGKGCRVIATSADGGKTWSPQADDKNLVEPVCQASMIRLSTKASGGKNRLLFSNPASTTARERMIVRLSYDEGKTWPVSKIVYDGPSSYSCMTVLPDDTIGLLYERGQSPGDPAQKITFARFNLEWLTDGKDQLQTKDLSMKCHATGIVYRNPEPHLRAVHAWHPSLVLLDDGELISTFDLGQGAESLDYRTYLSRSKDQGKTWTPPVRLFEDPIERRSTHTVRISRLPDGTLVGFGGRLYRDDPSQGLVNRDNLGYVPMDLILLESRDGGRSWQGPRNIEPPLVGPSFEICHPICQLRDGRWLAPTSTWKGWDGKAPNGMNAVALVSRDQGKTWPEFIRVMEGYDKGIIHWEQSLVELPDGRLLAIAWAMQEKTGQTLPTPYAISQDGCTFGPPKPTGLNGQTAKILCLRDGRIFCLYRRHDKPGLWANLARIDGDAWINLDELPVWQGGDSGMAGRAPTGEELSNLKFGFPSMVQMPDGDVMAVFWCVEDGIYNIRWLRIRIGACR
jgi:sialidase-1